MEGGVSKTVGFSLFLLLHVSRRLSVRCIQTKKRRLIGTFLLLMENFRCIHSDQQTFSRQKILKTQLMKIRFTFIYERVDSAERRSESYSRVTKRDDLKSEIREKGEISEFDDDEVNIH